MGDTPGVRELTLSGSKFSYIVHFCILHFCISILCKLETSAIRAPRQIQSNGTSAKEDELPAKSSDCQKVTHVRWLSALSGDSNWIDTCACSSSEHPAKVILLPHWTLT